MKSINALPFGAGRFAFKRTGCYLSAPKNAIILPFSLGAKASEARTYIGGELIGRVKRRTEADSPFQPSPLVILRYCKAVVNRNVRSSL